MLALFLTGAILVCTNGKVSEAGAEKASQETEQAALKSEDAKIMATLDDIYLNQRRGMMNVPPEDGRVLRVLSEAMGAKHVVEIGTSNGYSGIWICLALRKTGGKLVTHEIDEVRAGLARKNFKRAGVDDLITLVMGDAHETVKKITEPIDILFLDADKEGYVDYLNKLLPLVRNGGLILAHNTNMRGAMQDYRKAADTNPALETIYIHKDGAGMSISLKKH